MDNKSKKRVLCDLDKNVIVTRGKTRVGDNAKKPKVLCQRDTSANNAAPTLAADIFSLPAVANSKTCKTEISSRDIPHDILDKDYYYPLQLEDIMLMEIKLDERLSIKQSYCCDPNCTMNAYRRQLLVEWLIGMQCMKVENDVLHLAVILMDVTLNEINVKEDEMQSVAAASLWLSHKFYKGGLKCKAILRYCEEATKESIKHFEKKVLQFSNFNLQYPNVTTMLHYFIISVEPFSRLEYYASCYLHDLMLIDINFVHETFAVRAVIALLTALYLFENPKASNILSLIKGEQRKAVSDGHHGLLQLLRSVRDNEDFRASSHLFRKYSSSKYLSISKNPAMNPDRPYLPQCFSDES